LLIVWLALDFEDFFLLCPLFAGKNYKVSCWEYCSRHFI